MEIFRECQCDPGLIKAKTNLVLSTMKPSCEIQNLVTQPIKLEDLDLGSSKNKFTSIEIITAMKQACQELGVQFDEDLLEIPGMIQPMILDGSEVKVPRERGGECSPTNSLSFSSILMISP